MVPICGKCIHAICLDELNSRFFYSRCLPVNQCAICDHNLSCAIVTFICYCVSCAFCFSSEDDDIKVPVVSQETENLLEMNSIIEHVFLITLDKGWFWYFVK